MIVTDRTYSHVQEIQNELLELTGLMNELILYREPFVYKTLYPQTCIEFIRTMNIFFEGWFDVKLHPEGIKVQIHVPVDNIFGI